MKCTWYALVLAILGATTTFAQSPSAVPAPTGAHSIGRRTFYLVDSARGEPATADTNDRREVVITVWYPTAATARGAQAPYMPGLDKYRTVVSDATLARWESLVSPVQVDATPAAGAFPVLFFSHGWGGRAASYSVWLTEMASQGFVVVGVDHPYMGVVATSGSVATLSRDDQFASSSVAERFYAEDLAFVRRQLATLNARDAVLRGTMQLDSLFVSGHSSGFGSAASAFASLFGGVRGLISFDSGVSSFTHERGLSAPLLLLRAESPSYTDIFVRGPRTDPHGTIYDTAVVRKFTAPFFDLQVLGTGHGTILDNSSATDAQRIFTTYSVAFMRSILAKSPAINVLTSDTNRVRLRRVVLPADSRD